MNVWCVLLWLGMVMAVRGGQFRGYFDANVPTEYVAAANVAMANVGQFLTLNMDVNIRFSWAPLDLGFLGSTTVPTACQDPARIYVVLPPALYVQLYGNTGNCASYDGTVFYHMTIVLNSAMNSFFYFGMDTAGLGGKHYDVVTTIMHEIVHGLGMKSEVVDAAGHLLNPPRAPLFDWIVFGGNVQAGWPSAGSNTPLSNPPFDDASVLVGGSLNFNGSVPFPLYAPSEFKYGVSVAHTNLPDLMFWRTYLGQSQRTLSAYVVGMLRTMGYQTGNCSAVNWSSPCANCDSAVACYTSSAESLHSLFKFQ